MVILNKLNKNTVKLLIFANHNAYRKKNTLVRFNLHDKQIFIIIHT